MSLATGASPESDPQVEDWFDLEAPTIIEGLERTGSITPLTAATARLLVAEGASTHAVRVVLSEAFE